jgi:ribosomal protein L11 methyltransferase
VEVEPARLEEARATMLELFPGGFEEVDRPAGVELAAYTDSAGEERLWAFFSGVRSSDVEGGWEDRWRAFHRPVTVGGLWVGPPWETPDPTRPAVVIDPGRAFGTGSHPTTQLCLGELQALDPGSLIDVGCGSGVLAIAAALLGHVPVLAVDVEPPAVEATRANAARNGVEVEVRLVDGDEQLPAADAAVANISLAAVLTLPAHVEADVLVTSGYLEPEEPELPGYRHLRRSTLGGWAADVHERL